MSQLGLPLLLLLIFSKASRQNEGQMEEREKIAGISRTERTPTNQQEHFETEQKEQTMAQQKRRQTAENGQEEGGGRATTKAKSKSRYLEFAETEFRRPSSYFPLPFVTPAGNRLQEIPPRTLSQLIRQHIARNRKKQLVAPENPTDNLRSVPSHEKEFRQTPFRRLPSNSTVLSYAEKRRQWKAELMRRLKEQKVRTRVIPPLLISAGGSSSSVLTDREAENRFYVTYSPKTRTYQVSRHPPPHLYTTDRDTLPQQLDEEPSRQIQTEEQQRQHQQRQEEGQTEEEDRSEEEPSSAETTRSPTTGESAIDNTMAELPSSRMVENDLPTAPTVEWSEATAVPKATVRRPALLVILQNAELMENGQSHRAQSVQHVQAVKTEEQQQKQPIKQIMILDDYVDEEGNEMADDANDSEGGEEDEFVAEENGEDEDMFFFKPNRGGGSSSTSLGGDLQPQNGRENNNDPFRIVVHETGRKI